MGIQLGQAIFLDVVQTAAGTIFDDHIGQPSPSPIHLQLDLFPFRPRCLLKSTPTKPSTTRHSLISSTRLLSCLFVALKNRCSLLVPGEFHGVFWFLKRFKF